MVVAALLCLLGVGLALRGRAASGATLDEGLVRVLAEREGLEVEPGSITWAREPSGLAPTYVLFLASPDGDAPDVFSAGVRAAGHTVLDVGLVTNVSRTPGAAETSLVRAGDFVAYLGIARERAEAITVVDLRGEPESLVRGWSRVARLQNAITSLQTTGRFEGLGRRRYAIEPTSERAELRVEEGRFVLVLPDARVVLDPGEATPSGDAERLVLAPEDKPLPGGIPWIVDTVRSLPFVGPEPIAWLENRVYGVRDRLLRLRYRLLGAPHEDESGLASAAERRRRMAAVAELGDVGFPPPPVPPPVDDATAGEGEWLPIVDDTFVGAYPNAAPAFAETSLRVDAERPFARAYLVAWDPRQVQMRAVSGSREPEGATGALGTGMIPRDERTLPRVVAGFNGGFQAMHGEFGMMADGVVYLPPKPYAATVGVMQDGRVTMGSWVGLPEGARSYTEDAALAQIPAGMVDYRQNLTSVIEGERWNPWERWYWGAANVNASEQTFVDRSGLCITRDGFVIYFYGNSMGPEALGEVMRRARCDRGMHLDMNSKLTAFEYYRVQPASVPFAPLGRPLAELEFERAYPGVAGFHVRGRMAVSRMEPQRFPRFVEVEPRDFFYLTLRPTLPGPALADGTAFDVHALPQTAYPWAFARATRGAATLVRIDASRAVPAPVDETMAVHGTKLVATLVGGGTGSRILVAHADSVGLHYAVRDAAEEGDVVVLHGRPLEAGSTSAVGVDADGFLVYAEGSGLEAALAAAGVTQALALEGRLVVGAGDAAAYVDGEAATAAPGLAFLERATPYTEILNPDLVPTGYASWGRIQDTRIRYRPAPGPRRFNQGQ